MIDRGRKKEMEGIEIKDEQLGERKEEQRKKFSQRDQITKNPKAQTLRRRRRRSGSRGRADLDDFGPTKESVCLVLL